MEFKKKDNKWTKLQNKLEIVAQVLVLLFLFPQLKKKNTSQRIVSVAKYCFLYSLSSSTVMAERELGIKEMPPP